MKCINVHLTSYYRLFNICFDTGFFRSKPSVVSLKNFQAGVIDKSVKKCRNMYDFDINATNLFSFQVSEFYLFRLEYFRFVRSVFWITCELSNQ